MTQTLPHPPAATEPTRETPDTVVLAYSGGLDTSVAVPWLRETRGVDVRPPERRVRAGHGRRPHRELRGAAHELEQLGRLYVARGLERAGVDLARDLRREAVAVEGGDVADAGPPFAERVGEGLEAHSDGGHDPGSRHHHALRHRRAPCSRRTRRRRRAPRGGGRRAE